MRHLLRHLVGAGLPNWSVAGFLPTQYSDVWAFTAFKCALNIPRSPAPNAEFKSSVSNSRSASTIMTAVANYSISACSNCTRHYIRIENEWITNEKKRRRITEDAILTQIQLKVPTVLIYIKGAPYKTNVRITPTTSNNTSLAAASRRYSITSAECSKNTKEYDRLLPSPVHKEWKMGDGLTG